MSIAVAYTRPAKVPGEFLDTMLQVRRDSRVREIARKKVSGSRLATTRNVLTRWFLDETRSSHLWWIDSDMSFQAEPVLTALLDAGQPIVAAHCRGMNEDGTTFPAALVREGERLRRITDKEMRGNRLQVFSVGMACTLIEREVLETLGTGIFWPYALLELFGQDCGEDTVFCHRAAEKGFAAYVLPGTKVGHVKEIVV